MRLFALMFDFARRTAKKLGTALVLVGDGLGRLAIGSLYAVSLVLSLLAAPVFSLAEAAWMRWNDYRGRKTLIRMARHGKYEGMALRMLQKRAEFFPRSRFYAALLRINQNAKAQKKERMLRRLRGEEGDGFRNSANFIGQGDTDHPDASGEKDQQVSQ